MRKTLTFSNIINILIDNKKNTYPQYLLIADLFDLDLGIDFYAGETLGVTDSNTIRISNWCTGKRPIPLDIVQENDSDNHHRLLYLPQSSYALPKGYNTSPYAPLKPLKSSSLLKSIETSLVLSPPLLRFPAMILCTSKSALIPFLDQMLYHFDLLLHRIIWWKIISQGICPYPDLLPLVRLFLRQHRKIASISSVKQKILPANGDKKRKNRPYPKP